MQSPTIARRQNHRSPLLQRETGGGETVEALDRGIPVDLLTYSSEDTVVQVDDHAIEAFRRLVTGSQRCPLQWLAVGLVPSRPGDRIEVRIGQSSAAGKPFYDPDVISQEAFSFTVPSSEESVLRGFFDQVAQRAGRAP
ncbi:MAG TPA: hypothetical protein VK217_02235 [Acidimicrobiales bacterium]|nr:hypothetical protein [Acidimicrobiales bacterium]